MKCDACGVVEFGRQLHERLSLDREHLICGYCRGAWRRLDKRVGRQATWEEFLNPTPRQYIRKKE